jgi:hypothetical protein
LFNKYPDESGGKHQKKKRQMLSTVYKCAKKILDLFLIFAELTSSLLGCKDSVE